MAYTEWNFISNLNSTLKVPRQQATRYPNGTLISSQLGWIWGRKTIGAWLGFGRGWATLRGYLGDGCAVVRWFSDSILGGLR